MLYSLSSAGNIRALALFTHLAPVAVLQGAAPGEIWGDDPFRPASVLVNAGHRYYLAGAPDNADFNQSVRDLFLNEVYPRAQQAGTVEFGLYPAPGWDAAVGVILAGKDPILAQRQQYRLRGGPPAGWREKIPAGLWVEQVSAALLEEDGLGSLEDLREELVSECPTQEYFLQNRFGFCLRSQHELAGWCLSEYNCGSRCEIGIETVEKFQRRGVAKAAASALLEYAPSQGITEIGWDCYSTNQASAAAALSLGFELHSDYSFYFAWFDEPSNLAVHGNLCLRQGQFVEAVDWFERAMLTGQLPAWAYITAAIANGACGNLKRALDCVRLGLQGGFGDREFIRSNEHLRGLHAADEWREWFGEEM